MTHRERCRDDGLAQAERAGDADRLDRRHLVEVDAVADEVVERERLDRDDLDPGVDRGDPVAFDAPDDGDPTAAELGVTERVADADRHRMPELRRAQRVAHDQDVGHGREPSA